MVEAYVVISLPVARSKVRAEESTRVPPIETNGTLPDVKEETARFVVVAEMEVEFVAVRAPTVISSEIIVVIRPIRAVILFE